MPTRAPVLISDTRKPKGKFAEIPWDIFSTVCNRIDGRHGNALKLLFFLIGTEQNGGWRVTEADIENRLGMNSKRYRESRAYLAELGLIEYIPNTHIKILYNNILPNESSN